MSIFGIIAISALVGLASTLFVLIVYVIVENCTCYCPDETVWSIIAGVVALLVWIGSVFAGIAINEEQERLFIVQYEAQKEVIESSLESDVMTGFERVELVKQASELNSELARRKAKYDIWHYVTYGGDLYDNVEPIQLK